MKLKENMIIGYVIKRIIIKPVEIIVTSMATSNVIYDFYTLLFFLHLLDIILINCH